MVSRFDNEFFIEDFSIGEREAFLINELYGKQRGQRVEVYDIKLDAMWSFVELI